MAARRTIAVSIPRSFRSSLMRQATDPALAKSPPLTGNSWRKTDSATAMASVLDEAGHARTGLEHGHPGGDQGKAAGPRVVDDLGRRPLALDEDDPGQIGHGASPHNVPVGQARQEERARLRGRQNVAHEIGGEDLAEG